MCPIRLFNPALQILVQNYPNDIKDHIHFGFFLQHPTFPLGGPGTFDLCWRLVDPPYFCNSEVTKEKKRQQWVFNKERTDKHLLSDVRLKFVCLICQETVAVFKEHNISCHFSTKHANCTSSKWTWEFANSAKLFSLTNYYWRVEHQGELFAPVPAEIDCKLNVVPVSRCRVYM